LRSPGRGPRAAVHAAFYIYPLAGDEIAKGGHALNPRGEFYTTETIQERLVLRNYMDELWGPGVRTGVAVVSTNCHGMDALTLECGDFFGALGRLAAKVECNRLWRERRV
jgi:hypothetical protein